MTFLYTAASDEGLNRKEPWKSDIIPELGYNRVSIRLRMISHENKDRTLYTRYIILYCDPNYYRFSIIILLD